MKRLACGASFGVLVAAMGTAVYAQETTGTIRGQAIGADGNPVANASVAVTHVPTGTVVNTATGADGYFTARGLRVGGPYTVAVTANGETETTRVASVGVGTPVNVDVAFAGAVEEVVVTATAMNREENGGPTSNFQLSDIEDLPSMKRDLKDLARLNPFITLDPSNLDAVVAGGVSNRYNSLTVDGVKQNDDFGLNNNGYPTQRSPISTDAVQAMSVNLAPYSVLYNDFQGANINVVTKSGSNEFHGSAFYEYSDQDLIGDKAEGQTFTNVFEEKSYGATLGGPIIRDRLFFFGSYEKFEAERGSIAGPVGSGKPIITGNGSTFVTPAQITAIENTLASVYGYTLDQENSILDNLSLPEEDEKWLGKLDWNITDAHRLAVTYQKTNGTRLIEGNRSSSTQLALYSNYYIKGDDLEVYTAQLNSDWSENLRSELVATKKKVVTLQQPVGGESGNGEGAGDEEAEIGQFSIAGNPAALNTNTRILAGPDVSRHANELENEVTNYRGRVFYDLGDHQFSFGVEKENLKVYNLFGQRTEAEFTFFSLANLQNRLPDQVQYQNAIVDANGDGQRNEQDLAAQFDYDTWNIYAQDTLRITPELSVTAGFRYTRLVQDDRPLANSFFQQRYGFSNSENLDGRDVMMPRVSFEYTPQYEPEWGSFAARRLRLTGGFGLFSGGSATVWVSNSFSNTGVLGATIFCARNQTNTNCGRALGTDDNAVLNSLVTAADYRNLPAAFENLLNPALPTIETIRRAASANGIDPAFQPVQTWKSSLSFSADLAFPYIGENYNFTIDFLRGDVKEAILWKDYRAGLTPVGTAPDGRPVYRNATQRGAFIAGSGNDTGNDLVLTNTDEGFQQAWAFSMSKAWENGIDASLSYTLTDAKDVNPGTSSVAFSNWGNLATADINDPGLATSNYEIKHQFKGRFSFRRAFFGDNETNVSLFFQHRSGNPYSFVYNLSSTNALALFGDGASNRQLFYVPQVDSAGNVTLTSDPIVTYASGFDINRFNEYLKGVGLTKYAGRISPRNGFRSDDVTTFDLRISQELPAFFPGGAKIQAYMDLVNIGNMLNDEWGTVRQVDFFYAAPIVGVASAPGNRYQYQNFTPAVKTLSNSDAPNRSLWQVKFGLKYSF
ncbi:TonB-dependent receptor [Phenylobacterium sp. J367]|uniref:TonB-dependent receptor n=1 Tax=Phenylobacterium sp. J367 TaxID=2898435 RepID=UPI00215096F5|nr:carboxypeptidase regulatory-like domain-containing protein [Phenylobacterium sp. J367]MCR5877766.1 carboxypeptidase regulatory-like domain-containing protein [Phenylobacterium sp. J367]